jgi:hypothetical protein
MADGIAEAIGPLEWEGLEGCISTVWKTVGSE